MRTELGRATMCAAAAGLIAVHLFLAGSSQAASADSTSTRFSGMRRDSAQTPLRTVYLIRHGWYDADDPRDARVGKQLDSLGRAQTQRCAGRLAKLPFRMNTLVSSTFQRAIGTADLIGDSLHMTPLRDSLISECGPPSSSPPFARERATGEADTCQARLERAWARYMRPAEGQDQHDVLVCHGNVIRWFVCRALGVDLKQWPRFDIANASITAITIRADGSTYVALFSDVGHLPPALQTWTGRGAGWSPPLPIPTGRQDHPPR